MLLISPQQSYASAHNFKLEYVVDSTNEQSFSEIKEFKFKAAESHNLNFGIQPNTFWLKVTLDSLEYFEGYLSVRRAIWDSLTISYLDHSGKLVQSSFGYYVKTGIEDKNTNFPFVEINSNNVLNHEIYIKGNNRYAMLFPISLESDNKFFQNNLKSNVFEGLLIGGLLIMFIYNFFLWIMLRDRSYLLYVITVFLTVITQSGLHGYTSYFLTPLPSLDYYIVRLGIAASLVMNSIFTIQFLSVKKHSKILYRTLLINAIISASPLIFDAFGMSFLAVKLLMLSSTITALLLMITGYILWLKKKVKTAMYYSFAWTLFIIGLFIYITKTTGTLPHNWFTDNFVHLGRFIEISLLSFALGYRYNELKRDKEKLQKQLTNELGELVEQRTAALNSTLKEKEVLLNEVHHRVKNNLQIINSMLAIQSRRFPDTVKNLLKSVQNRIGSISLVHEQLYTDKIYSALNAKEYLSKLISTLENSLFIDESNISIEIETGKQINIVIDMAIPFGLILNEIISNAIKYAFHEDEKGSIKISLQETENSLILEAKDNGHGDKNSESNSKNSMRIRIIEDMSRQLNATLSINKEEGYHYIITIPK